jgi:hypothetical protein
VNPSPFPWSIHPMTNSLGTLHEVFRPDGTSFKAASVWIGSGSTIIGQFTHYSPSDGVPSPTHEEMHANARLAIAAPKLLEACKRALALLEDPDGDEFKANEVESDLLDAIRQAAWGIP